MELDEIVQALWETIKELKWTGSAQDLKTRFKGRINKTVETSPSYPFLLSAVDRACKGNADLFHQAVEGELGILFPKLQPEVPTCVRDLSFLMHAAVYKRNCCPRKGLTLLDEFLDFKVEDLQPVLVRNPKVSKYVFAHGKGCSGEILDPEFVAKLSNADFNALKWKILKAVLELLPNSICEFPGLEIIDIILPALDVEEATLLSKSTSFVTRFPAKKKELPACLLRLTQQLAGQPIPPDAYRNFVTDIPAGDAADETILIYMGELHAALMEKGIASKKSMLQIFRNKLGVAAKDLQSEADNCERYIFTENILNMVQSLYPDSAAVGGIANWFMATATAQDLLKGVPLTCSQILTGADKSALYYLQFKAPQATKEKLDSLFSEIVSLPENSRQDRLLQELSRLTTKPVKDTPRVVAEGGVFTTMAGPALLMRRYRFQALNHLMYREVHLIDPVIADTLCELRPPFLLDCDVIIQRELQKFPGWQGLVKAYNANYAGRELNEKLMTSPLELIGRAPDPYEYLQLCEALETALQKLGKEYYPRYLALCKCLTRSNLMPRDHLGIEMGEISIQNMPGNELRRRRAEMGSYNIWYTKYAAGLLQNSPFLTCPAFASTAKVLMDCNVMTPDARNAMPIVPIYQAQTFALLKAFELGHPIILRMKRVHITSHDGPPRNSCGLQDKTIIEQSIPNAEYLVAGSEVLVYMPNQKTGRFELAPDAPDDLPGLAVSAYSILDLTGSNPAGNDPGYKTFVHPDYYTKDPAAYFEFLKTQDIVNLLNVCSANHPVFVDNATKLMDPQKIFEIESGPYSNELTCWTEIEKERKARKKIENQFNFLEELYGVENNTLASAGCDLTFGQETSLCTNIGFGDFAKFYKMGEELDFANRIYMSGTLSAVEDGKEKNTNIIYRHNRNMPFYSIHIYCSTVGVEKFRAAKLHVSTPVERFENKDVLETRGIDYLLAELQSAKSMQ